MLNRDALCPPMLVAHVPAPSSLLWCVCTRSVLRDMMLTEIIARTLKNILRCFQRKWMKAEKSTSEQGMRMLGEGFFACFIDYIR